MRNLLAKKDPFILETACVQILDALRSSMSDYYYAPPEELISRYGHPTNKMKAAYLLNKLDPVIHTAMGHHLDVCRFCKTELAEWPNLLPLEHNDYTVDDLVCQMEVMHKTMAEFLLEATDPRRVIFKEE